jgi:hypothetical protein
LVMTIPMKTTKWLYTALMIVLVGHVHGQFKLDIQYVDAKVKHDTNCSALHYNLRIPHLIGDGRYADVMAMVNDSIDALVREADVPTPEEVEYWNSLTGLCDETGFGPDKMDMTYEEGLLDAKYVSVVVITSYLAGNGGRGGLMECHTFNLDIGQKKALQWKDNLTDKNRLRLHEKMKEEFRRLNNDDIADEMEVEQLKGWSVTDKDVIFYYARIIQPGFELIIPVRLPIKDVRSYFIPKYRRLLPR